jgi:hypothetical protein
MARYRFVQRRQIWLPTFLGWLTLVGIAGPSFILAGYWIHPFLAINKPIPGARLLVVEGWLEPRELDQAIEVFRNGRYQLLATTGGPIERWSELSAASNYADLAAGYLMNHGLPSIAVKAVPAPASAQDRTFLSAVKLREWIRRQGTGIDSLDVFSGGTHARRSRMLYRMALGPSVNVGIMSARPHQYDRDHWWQSSAGVKSVVGEAIGVAWTVCCFYPPPPGSHEERWAEPRQGSI